MGNCGESRASRGWLPDRVRYLRDQLELLLLNILCGQVSAGQRRGEPAVRGAAEPLKPGVPGRLVDPRDDVARRLDRRGLAGHETEDDLLVVGRLRERLARPRPPRVRA